MEPSEDEALIYLVVLADSVVVHGLIQLLGISRLSSEEFRAARNMWVRESLLQNTFSWDNNLFHLYSDAEFWTSFRMTRETFKWFAEEIFGPYGFCKREDGPNWRVLSLAKRTAIFIWRLAHGDSEASVGQKFNVDQSTVNKIVKEGLRIIKDHWTDKYITWPVGERAEKIVQDFEDFRGFPRVIAAIDGTHIPIVKPSLGGADYFNYKQYHSIIVLAAVDKAGYFLSIDAGICGSYHDNRALSLSNLNKRISEGLIDGRGHWLLGDSAFSPPKRWLMCPYKRVRGELTQQQRHFNYRLSATRIIVFGMLKARWRILLQKVIGDLDTTVQITGVCCTLHNMLLSRKEPVDPGWIRDARLILEAATEMTATGNADATIAAAGLSELEAFELQTEAQFQARMADIHPDNESGDSSADALRIRDNLAATFWEYRQVNGQHW